MRGRMSHGTVGNRPSSLYPQYDLYSVSSSYNENSGALISVIGNKDLTWEKTYTTSIGLDAALFNNRLRFNLIKNNVSASVAPAAYVYGYTDCRWMTGCVLDIYTHY